MSKVQIDDVHEGFIEFINNGNASIKINEKTFFIFKNNTKNALHNDLVKVQIIKKGNKLEGKVIEVLQRNKTKFVGKVQKNKKTTFVIVDNNKIHVDFYIKDDINATTDQKVLIEFIDWKDDEKSPRANIITIIGESGVNDTEMNAIMYEYDLPIEFPLMVEAEAELISEEITQEEIDKRRDLRNVITIGIDPFDSKDADDTIGLEFKDGYRYVSINIADVTHYVKEGSEIDKEAYERGTSVYLVDRVIPMLPKRLSNNICSLKAGKDKLSYSVIIKFDEQFNIVDRWFGRTVIHVNKDYSYEQAQDVIENGVKEETKDTDHVVLELDRIAKKLRSIRIKNSLELNGVEVKFILDENSKPTGVYYKEQKDSNKLIEEFMLLANMEVAKFIKSKNLPCVNRIHESPDIIKIQQVKDFVSKMGYELDVREENIKESLNKLVREVKGTNEENIVNALITRSQKKALYSTRDIGHFGLGFKNGHYCHYTSCIRRYSDVLIHRILSLALGNDGYPKKDNL